MAAAKKSASVKPEFEKTIYKDKRIEIRIDPNQYIVITRNGRDFNYCSNPRSLLQFLIDHTTGELQRQTKHFIVDMQKVEERVTEIARTLPKIH